MATAYNIGILGDGGVGKTAFIRSLKHNSFEPRYMCTVGMEAHPLHQEVVIWDFAGQEKYGPLNTKKLSGINAVVLMYDVTSTVSFMNATQEWNQVIKDTCRNIPVVLVGNKVDCSGRKVFISDIRDFTHREIPYVDISAKTGFNVEIPITILLQKLRKN